MSNLPKSLKPYAHLETINRADISNQDKLDLVAKYKHGILINHGDKSTKFDVPQTDLEKEFVLDMIIHQLEMCSTKRPGTQVAFMESLIKWLIRECRSKLKREPNLLELEAPI